MSCSLPIHNRPFSGRSVVLASNCHRSDPERLAIPFRPGTIQSRVPTRNDSIPRSDPERFNPAFRPGTIAIAGGKELASTPATGVPTRNDTAAAVLARKQHQIYSAGIWNWMSCRSIDPEQWRAIRRSRVRSGSERLCVVHWKKPSNNRLAVGQVSSKAFRVGTAKTIVPTRNDKDQALCGRAGKEGLSG
jgi:hypothetical protein